MIINNEKHYDLIKFEDGDFSLDVKVSPDEDIENTLVICLMKN